MKVADTTTITILNDKAIALGRNQSLDPDALRSLLDPDGVHVCEFTMLHEHQGGRPTDPHMRTRWLLKVKGSDLPQAGLIDIEMEDFDQLDEADEKFKEAKEKLGWKHGNTHPEALSAYSD